MAAWGDAANLDTDHTRISRDAATGRRAGPPAIDTTSETDVSPEVAFLGRGSALLTGALGAGRGAAPRVANALLGLQHSVGNRTVLRMVGRAALSRLDTAQRRPFPTAASNHLQRFEAGEHAQLGAKAGEAEKKFTVNDVEFTYGETIAMGDLFKNPDDLRKASKTELEALRTLIRRERDKGIGSVSEQDWIDAAGQRYLDLAAKNTGHFAPANPAAGSAEGEGDNKSTWFMYHNRALALAQQNKMDQAFITNAFGDHFLTDAFSAGHLINKDSVVATAKMNLTDPKKFETGIATAVLKNASGAKLFQYEANPGALSAWTDMSVRLRPESSEACRVLRA